MRVFTWLALSPALALVGCTSEQALIEPSAAPIETAAARAAISDRDRDKLLALVPQTQNPKGEIASVCTTDQHERRACIRYRGDSTFLESRYDFSVARAINQSGDAVGEYWQGGTAEAFAWIDGVFHDLPELGGSHTLAVDINARGQIVGTSETGLGAQGSHAVLWENTEEVIDLGTLGGLSSSAIAIDESGRVVGTSTTVDGVLHYFVWKNGVMTDLGPV